MNYEISTVQETKPGTTPHKTSRPLMGTGAGHEVYVKPCKLYDDDNDRNTVQQVDIKY